MSRGSSFVVALPVVALFAGGAIGEENWPQFRGPNQDGHAHEPGLPVEWSADDVAWKTPLEGWGQSSPVVWGERIYLTTALDRGAKRVVLCFDRNDGRKLWEQVAWTGTPEKTHDMNGWASATCATDGERVYAFFGKGGGLFCYTVDGELVWNAGNDRLGQFEGPWGTAASPILWGDLVIQNGDADANSFLAAFDKRTGEQVWRVERPQTRGWSTPIVLDVDGREELILNGHYGPVAYDPATGREFWSSPDDVGRGEPSATPTADGLILCDSGKNDGSFYAVKPGGSGVKERVWSAPRKGGRDLPSPVAIDEHALIVNMAGTLACHDTATGEQLYRSRIEGEYSAAPIAYDGKAFFVNESGTTIVVEPASELKIVATNTVGAGEDELFRASLVPSDGQLFLRSDKFLYCIGERK